jgi:hypothetical protein
MKNQIEQGNAEKNGEPAKGSCCSPSCCSTVEATEPAAANREDVV